MHISLKLAPSSDTIIQYELTESYNLVQFDPSEVSINRWTCSSTADCVSPWWKRSLSCTAVCSPKAAKHGNDESMRFQSQILNDRNENVMRLDTPFCINSTRARWVWSGQHIINYIHIWWPSTLTDYPITMFSRSLEPLLEQPLKFTESRRLNPSQDFNIFQWQFERSSFEPDVSWWVWEHETKVDMDEMPIAVE